MKKIFLLLLISLELFAGSYMCGSGTIIRLLNDDNQGSRHQKFIIKQLSGRTLLIAHNIDIAPKIYSIQKGKIIKFCGEYINNSRGGIVHWTHHDPQGKHRNGWLKYQGESYQ